MKTFISLLSQPKKPLPDMRSGDTIRVHEKIKEGGKERIQVFSGVIISRKHGSEPGASFTVRKVTQGVGIEKIFPLHSPLIEKIEISKRGRVRRAKLYYLSNVSSITARKKLKQFTEAIAPPVPEDEARESDQE